MPGTADAALKKANVEDKSGTNLWDVVIAGIGAWRDVEVAEETGKVVKAQTDTSDKAPEVRQVETEGKSFPMGLVIGGVGLFIVIVLIIVIARR